MSSLNFANILREIEGKAPILAPSHQVSKPSPKATFLEKREFDHETKSPQDNKGNEEASGSPVQTPNNKRKQEDDASSPKEAKRSKIEAINAASSRKEDTKKDSSATKDKPAAKPKKPAVNRKIAKAFGARITKKEPKVQIRAPQLTPAQLAARKAEAQKKTTTKQA